MKDREWLQWIKPVPVDEEEISRLEAQLQGFIRHVRKFAMDDRPAAEIQKSICNIAKYLEKAKVEIDGLPKEVVPTYQSWSDQVAPLLSEVMGHISSMTPPRKGRPIETSKNLCIACTYGFLYFTGKNHGCHEAGPVVNLARWIWIAAGGQDTTTLGSWRDLAGNVMKDHKSSRPLSGKMKNGKCTKKRSIKWPSLGSTKNPT